MSHVTRLEEDADDDSSRRPCSDPDRFDEDARRGLARAFADAIDGISSIKKARIGRRRTHGRRMNN